LVSVPGHRTEFQTRNLANTTVARHCIERETWSHGHRHGGSLGIRMFKVRFSVLILVLYSGQV
jgi:hypothetical protein